MKPLVVAPTRREAAACGHGAFVSNSATAGEALSQRLARERPSLVLIAGVCGGLDPSLAPSSIILCRRVTAQGQPDLGPDPALFEAARRRLRLMGLPFVSSVLLTVGRPAGSVREKTALWNEHGAAGVDMETYALAQAAVAHRVPWLALRAVVDPAGATLPRDVRTWRDEVDERTIARRLAVRPLEWPACIRLALGLRRALCALAQATGPVADAASTALASRIDVVV